jgi:Lamin Tail Domain
MIKHVASAAAAGIAAVFAVAAPAAAATTPTLTAPAVRTGFGLITLTGTAAPGATVQLYETAQTFDDLQPADDWENGGGPVTATANASGRFSINRLMDSGFFFQVAADGLRSNKIKADIRVAPTLNISASGTGAVTATVAADPAQPGLSVELQRASGSNWVTVDRGATGEDARFSGSDSGLFAGTYTYRAHIATDPKNGVLANYSSALSVRVEGPTNPNPSTPTTPKPSTPKPATPAVGSLQFTKIQYDSPGADNRSNTSLNGEWFRVTNKTRSTMALKGWTVRDAANLVYTFGTFNLGAGKSIVVRTGKGSNGSTYRYWGRTGYVWNNTGDTAILRTGAGKTIDTCRWGKGKGSTTC